MRKHFRRDTCRLCDSPEMEMVMSFQPTPVGDHYVTQEKIMEEQDLFPLDLYFCKQCGQLQLLDVVNPEFIYRDYIYETGNFQGMVRHFEDYANNLIKMIGLKQGDFVVDIGCNDGSFLKCFYDNGMNVLGIEPATRIAQKVKAKNMDVKDVFFSYDLAREIKKTYGAVKMISANNVMANVENMNDFIEGISFLLADDGVFIFESGYAVDTLNNSVMDNVYHEHLCYFRLNPLVKFFKQHGLEIFEAERVDTKGGSLRGMAQKTGGKRSVTPTVGKRIKMEESLGLETVAFYKSFASRMEMAREELITLLDELTKTGKKISGYGASVGVTTLIYYYGTDKYIDVLYDDNPAREGLFSPGKHIPVLSSEDIYKQDPDYIICFAWRYKDQIIKKNQKYLDEGGHFIVPLPGLKVI